ncbi:Invertebrate-type lysozyme 6 [Aphelenchoides fujianensis]|nr:Invertebrate-type lysozyme 6 [Aphelenchoides fujianensis]
MSAAMRFALGVFVILSHIDTNAANGDCLAAICEVESNCRPLGCHEDLKLNYYLDCGKPNFDGDLERSWKKCAVDYECASRCNYYNRYRRKCSNVEDECEKMARLHNGGPAGCRNPATIAYWNQVKKHL